MFGPQMILKGGACQLIWKVSFSIVMGCQHIGKDRHHNKEKDDHPADRPQGFSRHSLMKKSANRPRRLGSMIGDGVSMVLLMFSIFQ